MIGIYDYTVILTYLSVVSGILGSIVSLHGMGHPYYGILFLLFSGLCDTFDGRVARSKPNRTPREKAFGVQIDSLADLISFGFLPVCIGIATIHVSDVFTDVPHFRAATGKITIYPVFFFIIIVIYLLAGLIRLAFFNVLDAENTAAGRQTTSFIGLPITSAALIFPSIMLLQYVTPIDIAPVYFVGMLITAFLFICKFEIRKPKLSGILFLVGIGVIEFIIFLICHNLPIH